MSSGKGTAGSGDNANTAGDGVPPVANDAPSAPAPAPSRSRPRAPPASSRPVPNPMFGSGSSMNNAARTASTPTAARSSTPGGSLASSRPTISMVPSRGRSTSGPGPGPGAAGSTAAGPSRMTFKPVIPQRRKPTESTQVKSEPGSSSTDPSGASPSPSERGGRGGARGGGGRGSGRGGGRGGGRAPVEMVASGPFSMGTGSTSKYERSKRMASGSSAGALSMSGGDKWQGETEADNLRPSHPPSARASSYRDPDKFREKEEYSDQEEQVEIVDLDDVGELDTMAPRALPRMQVDEKKKKKQKEAKKKAAREQGDKAITTVDPTVKADPEDVEMAQQAALTGEEEVPNGVSSDKKEEPTTISPDSTPSDDAESDDDRTRDGKVVDALDLSESEEEETMDDLVDDFFFDAADHHHLDTDHRGVDPSNRLYLFQFPQLFPEFKPRRKEDHKKPKTEQPSASASSPPSSTSTSAVKSALSSSPPGGSSSKSKRSVAFAEGTTGGSGAPDRGSGSGASTSIKREHPDDSLKPHPLPGSSSSSSSSSSGKIGKLKVYRDGRVEMHFSRRRSKSQSAGKKKKKQPLIMELTGGSQTSFLQDLALLDPVKREAYILGEIQRKFVCSPGVEGMLDDALRVQERRSGGGVKSEEGDESSDSSASESESEKEGGKDNDKKPAVASTTPTTV